MYKIVPNLEKGEYERERKFYADRGLPCPKDQIAEESEEAAKEDKMTPDANTNMDFHRFDELGWVPNCQALRVLIVFQCLTRQL